MRNVTFIHQKEKGSVPNFGDWYAGWQARLKSDPSARWLVEARNRVVKEGDLETNSTARVGVRRSYDAPISQSFDIEPSVPTKAVVSLFLKTAMPAVTRGVLSVERRWETGDLPGQEIMDALAHVFGLLLGLVGEAHSAQQRAFKSVQCRGTSTSPLQAPNCMRVANASRTVHVNLATREVLSFKERGFTYRPTNRDASILQDRYGHSLDLGSKSLPEYAQELHQVGRRMLEVDGYHITFIHVFRDGKPVHMMSPQARDHADKVMLAAWIVDEIARHHGDAVIAMAETWHARVDPRPRDITPEDEPERTEALATVLLCRDGADLGLISPFIHVGDKIQLRDVEERSRPQLLFLDPLRRFWKLPEARIV